MAGQNHIRQNHVAPPFMVLPERILSLLRMILSGHDSVGLLRLHAASELDIRPAAGSISERDRELGSVAWASGDQLGLSSLSMPINRCERSSWGSGADGNANSGPYHNSSLLHSMKTNTISGSNPISTRLGRWLRPTRLAFPAALALALTGLARAENARIPFSEIGAKATADYQGDALGITATPDGARLRCGFQKLEGHATTEGLWLESTVPGGGKFRLVAAAVGRGGSRAAQCAPTEAASSVRSGMSIVTVPQGDQAPLGAPCTHGAASFFDMPLLTELETTFSDVPFYRHAAPNGAIACLRQGAQTLARTGKVSAEDKLVRFTRPGVTEEYSVSVDGVRQDFVIAERPAGTGDLRVELALTGARAEAAAYGAKADPGRLGAGAGLQPAAGDRCDRPGTEGAVGS